MSSYEGEAVDVKERNEEDIVTILVATDIHLGYGERNAKIAEDSFVTFEEVLKIAKREAVDILLLGGDLFHDARPSSYALNKCIELLKRYCLGDRPIEIEFLSDGAFNFSSTINDTVNYEDPNINIELPVFSIHGNHDDPTGVHQISALNILSSTGLVNYFGIYNRYDDIDIEPILLRKGQTKIALYGLSHIKDERLGRLFLDKKVNFLTPPEVDEWFQLFVLHQNRANRGAKNFIPDDALPELLDLVIWGHEHDCRIDPETNSNKVHICQPGSTVATSLSVGESLQKHVGLFKIHKKEFKLEAIPLKTVRPFIFDEFVFGNEQDDEMLMSKDKSDHQEMAKRVVGKKIDEMIERAKALNREGNKLPLIRLNVSYNKESQAFNPIRFGESYVDKVANPSDMIKIKCMTKKEITRKDKAQAIITEDQASRVEELVADYFERNTSEKLKFFPVNKLNEAVSKAVDSNNMDILDDVIKYVTETRLKKLKENSIEIENIQSYCAGLLEDEDANMFDEILSRTNRQASTSDTTAPADVDADETDESPPIESPKKATKARGGRGSRGGRGAGRGRGRAKTTV
ncbi:double strand break repair nuclease mre11 [Rhynchophorus ferrugineus]|uniref:double strand break repair nuclease mre11 n=1 Tax=Rhynchophorus ferrugineus TaxID=354439 RepID=UPI003FCC4251